MAAAALEGLAFFGGPDVGREPRVRVWRIKDFGIVEQGDKERGSFFSGAQMAGHTGAGAAGGMSCWTQGGDLPSKHAGTGEHIAGAGSECDAPLGVVLPVGGQMHYTATCQHASIGKASVRAHPRPPVRAAPSVCVPAQGTPTLC